MIRSLRDIEAICASSSDDHAAFQTKQVFSIPEMKAVLALKAALEVAIGEAVALLEIAETDVDVERVVDDLREVLIDTREE